jgi:hypothetical protein
MSLLSPVVPWPAMIGSGTWSEPVMPERAATLIRGHKTRPAFERDNIVCDGDLRKRHRR